MALQEGEHGAHCWTFVVCSHYFDTSCQLYRLVVRFKRYDLSNWSKRLVLRNWVVILYIAHDRRLDNHALCFSACCHLGALLCRLLYKIHYLGLLPFIYHWSYDGFGIVWVALNKRGSALGKFFNIFFIPWR